MLDDVDLQAYLTRKAEILRDGLSLQIGGQATMPSTRFEGDYFSAGRGWIADDENRHAFLEESSKAAIGGALYGHWIIAMAIFAGRAGWKEIIAVADAGLKLIQ